MSATRFAGTWAVDSEWGYANSLIGVETAWEPVVFCAVNFESGERRSFWGKDERLRDFFRNQPRCQYLVHNIVAEIGYLLRLGINPPEHWFDTYVAERYLTNSPARANASLTWALHRRNLPHLAPSAKEDLRDRILRLDFEGDNREEREEIVDYCFSDCHSCLALYRNLNDIVPAVHMRLWVEYLKAVAQIQLRGIPFDVPFFEEISDRAPELLEKLCKEVNSVHSVFKGTSLNREAFFDWCLRRGIQWPAKRSQTTGKLYRPLDKDAFHDMSPLHPFIRLVSQVLVSQRVLAQRSYVVDPRDNRHFFDIHPFATITGRNAPRGFVFAGPKWLRHLVLTESLDHLLAYLDFKAQEIVIAAALSGDPVLLGTCDAKDCYLETARLLGRKIPGEYDPRRAALRRRFKTVALGVMYGIGSRGMAARLGVSVWEAEHILRNHRMVFRRFWSWLDQYLVRAYDRQLVVSPNGWRCRVPHDSKQTTWANWPMQAAGSDIMRLVVIYLEHQGVRVLAPVHDGFLLSCRMAEEEELRQAIHLACEKATESVLGVSRPHYKLDIYKKRFQEPDGAQLFTRILTLLNKEDRLHESYPK
jgi:DNA polymerase I-like protein with 3'-5' exonuclease and polymerase domains